VVAKWKGIYPVANWLLQ